jgi:hypothetical protein
LPAARTPGGAALAVMDVAGVNITQTFRVLHFAACPFGLLMNTAYSLIFNA